VTSSGPSAPSGAGETRPDRSAGDGAQLGPVPLGDLTLSYRREILVKDGTTCSGVRSDGAAKVYEVVAADGLHLTVHDTTWRNGERDICARERHDSPSRYDKLVDRLRLTVNTDPDGCRIDLRQARIRDGRPRLVTAAPDELTLGAGLDLVSWLRGRGAVVGTREELGLSHGRDPHRRRLAVRFAAEDTLLPVAVYALTRIAPVQREMSA